MSDMHGKGKEKVLEFKGRKSSCDNVKEYEIRTVRATVVNPLPREICVNSHNIFRRELKKILSSGGKLKR